MQNTEDTKVWNFDFYFKHCLLFSLSEPTFFTSEMSPSFQDLFSSVPKTRAVENHLTLWLTPQSNWPRDRCKHCHPQQCCDSGYTSFTHSTARAASQDAAWLQNIPGHCSQEMFSQHTLGGSLCKHEGISLEETSSYKRSRVVTAARKQQQHRTEDNEHSLLWANDICGANMISKTFKILM